MISKLTSLIFAFGLNTLLLTPLTPTASLAAERIEIDSKENIFKLLPSSPNLPRLRNGRHYPIIPKDVSETADLLAKLEQLIVDKNTPRELLPRISHQQQIIYREFSRNNTKANQLVSLLPEKLKDVALLHLSARREFLDMSRKRKQPSMMPAWEIIQPEPLTNLIAYYRKAEMATGINWEILAAINLVETGMGRISGVSVANAKGPMQFLQTTWDLKGIGNNGDINDPHDSIQAAARYLVRRGGLQDIRKGLWGYNNSDYYGRAVLKYAALIKRDPNAIRGFYHWEIHFNVEEGDIWLPVGYLQNKKIPISTYLQNFPVSAPPNYSSIR